MKSRLRMPGTSTPEDLPVQAGQPGAAVQQPRNRLPARAKERCRQGWRWLLSWQPAPLHRPLWQACVSAVRVRCELCTWLAITADQCHTKVATRRLRNAQVESLVLRRRRGTAVFSGSVTQPCYLSTIHGTRLRGSVGGSPPSQGVGWILGCSPDANGAIAHAAERRHRHPKVRARAAGGGGGCACRAQSCTLML